MLDADDKDDISHKLREDLDDYPVATVKFGIEEDRTDDPIWPTKGFKRSIDAEIGYADGFLMKVNTGYSFFKSIKKNLIYALNAELGMSPLDADKFGISERYFLGGSNTIRGFKYRGIGPKDSKDEDVAIGGATRLIINNELRYPIYDKLKGLVFMDIGMLDDKAFSLSSPRVSIGTGFRFDIPQASLKLDFALPLVKESHDDTEYVHFTIGTGLFF
jgi:outer membrane protein insertion porin family